MQRALAALTLGTLSLLALPSSSTAGGFDLRAGVFLPRADTGAANDLFRDDSILYTVEKKDWRGITGGGEYSFKLVDNVEMGIHLDTYGRTVHTAYRDFVRDDGREIRQDLRLSITPVGLTVRLVPTGRHARFAPYIGGGVDLVFWQYEESGDFVRFSDPTLPVIQDSFTTSTHVAPGFHVVGGLRIPLGRDFSLVAEGRYLWAKADTPSDSGFSNKVDLTGPSATIGLNVKF